jgi:hypothetical protein
MILTLDNLNAGLHAWETGKFPRDIHNSEYCEMYEVRSAGVTQPWWIATVNRLGKWRAYRSPNPPNSKAEITKLGLSRLSDVAAQYAKLTAVSGAEPSIVDHLWEDVAALFALAAGIKPWPPVFASKMCHFLFPKLFTVMDSTLTDPFEYEFYWRGMRDEWIRFKEKAHARSIFAEAIKSHKPIHDQYPWETKIMELSHIGWKSNRGRS